MAELLYRYRWVGNHDGKYKDEKKPTLVAGRFAWCIRLRQRKDCSVATAGGQPCFSSFMWYQW